MEEATGRRESLRRPYVPVYYHLQPDGPIHVCALVAVRADIEMGRAITKVEDPIVLYVSGGNTQVIAYSMNR